MDDLTPDAVTDRLEEVVANDGAVMLFLDGYRIGDDYEVECIAVTLTVSAQHSLSLHRNGDKLRMTTFFEPDAVPPAYRDRANPAGVVPMGLEFDLKTVSLIAEVEPPPAPGAA